MGLERTSGTDTRTDTTDSPNTHERPSAPQPDNPGAPGQPSRLESLRRAREEQHARAAQIAAARETEQRERPVEDNPSTEDQTQDTPAEPEDNDETREPADTAQEPDAGTDEAERDPEETDPQTEQPKQSDTLGEEPDTRDTDRLAADSSDETGQTRDGEAETEDLSEHDRPPLPRREERSSNTAGYDENAETDEAEQLDIPGETREPIEATEGSEAEAGEAERSSEDTDAQVETEDAEQPDVLDEEPHTQDTQRPLDETGQTQDGVADSQSPLPRDGERSSNTADRDADQETGEAERAPQSPDMSPGQEGQEVADEQVRAPGDPRPAGNQPGTSDAAAQPDAPALPPDWPPRTNDGGTRWSTPVYRIDDRTSGTQVEPRDRNAETQPETPTTTNEASDYRRLPELPRDGTPGRGELRPPEDDPADRDAELEERRRSRWEPLERLQAGMDGVKKATEGAKHYLDKSPPTGKAEVKTDTGSAHSPTTNAAANPTDVVLGAAIVATAAIGAIMRTVDKIKHREAEHE
ncbi:hypothetical protein BZB76_6823 [Actinomadura pelletieri DSM 43383]|uniref:Uncharacterized protein n=1 Tax=Actinomadura pelletieri DSM 43383 TaxID=1120940 RepID=A0A495Q8S5_9ACTN|nr:hypothetical protein [Actinomadura pelletieri]RKS67698.1 hypothetical protein BZB76_6823 [Actinomadura pelletieri DSM 43383]